MAAPITMTISARVYGFIPARAVAWTLSRLGVSNDNAMKWAMRCVFVRTKAGRHSSWLWGGR